MMHGLCNVRKVTWCLTSTAASMIMIHRQRIIICFKPVEIYFWGPQHFKDYSEVQTVVPQWPITQNTVFCQQRIENLAPR